MEFETLGEEERKLLMQVLDVDTNNLKCKYCGEKVEVKSCGITPPLTNGKTIITCNSPLCVMTHIVDLEEVEKSKEKMGAVFVKHISNHLQAGQKVICKICDKDIETIYREGGEER